MPTRPAGSVPVGAPLVVGVGALLTVGLIRRTAGQVRALRDAGARVAPLRHDLDLDAAPVDPAPVDPAPVDPAPVDAAPVDAAPVDGVGPVRHDERRLVVLGDSAAAGHGLGDPDLGLARRVGRRLHAVDGRPTSVRSIALDGATTTDVLHAQVDGAGDAEVVIVGVGVNDAVRPRSARRVRRELTGVLTRVRVAASPDATIVLIGCPDLSMAPGLPRVLRPPMGWRCRSVARAQLAVARDLGVPVVPLDRAQLTPEVFGPDGFHPGAIGHQRLADAVAALLTDGDRGAQRPGPPTAATERLDVGVGPPR